MSKNLKQLLRSAVFDAFQEGAKKTAAGPERPTKIFSYGTKFTLLDRVNDFCKYVPKEIRRPEQLTPSHVVNYLEQKADAGCTQATIDEYRSEVKKLGLLVGVDLSCDRVYSSNLRSFTRGANSVISPKDWVAILEYAKEHPSGSGVCLQLEALIGVRVSDIAYGVEIKDTELLIRSKNGKFAHRPITPQIRQIIDSKAFKSLMSKDGRFIAPKDGSINKYLNRIQDKLGLERHSFHDIRRRIAQDKYDELRKTGLTRQETLKAVSLWLNHGGSRERMLIESYIANAW